MTTEQHKTNAESIHPPRTGSLSELYPRLTTLKTHWASPRRRAFLNEARELRGTLAHLNIQVTRIAEELERIVYCQHDLANLTKEKIVPARIEIAEGVRS